MRRTIVTTLLVALCIAFAAAQTKPGGFDDHKNMMDQLGLKAIRPGPNPNNQSTFDEATANPYKDSMPDVLKMRNGAVVSTPAEWSKRRAEILEDFSREVYGRIPRHTPRVTWEVVGITPGVSGGVQTVTKRLIGHVDNREYPKLTVDIQANFTVPVHRAANVPIMIEFGFGFGGFGGFGRPNTSIPWTDQAIAKGWGYGTIVPTSFQPDSNQLETGIIGLCNHGQPRKPDQWGALRAWQWGVSRLIDYFESARDCGVDAKKVGIEGLSRYGKAAIVTEAFEPRIAVGLIGSSGEGGVKLHRHIYGEAVENLAGGEYYWMAGNFIKYGASDPAKTAADLPVDSHELIALCAPRPCFISYGVVEHGDAKWVDAHGSFEAGVLAGPAYKLLGKRDFGTPGDYLTDEMPPVGKLIGGELAWRQHEGGHDVTPNWPSFFEWVGQFVEAPAPTQGGTPYPLKASDPVPRSDNNSNIAHMQLMQKARTGGIDVYFEGDSITRRWGTSDPPYKEYLGNWKSNFYGWNAGNFGWGGDTTQNIIYRLKSGELDGVNPKVIVVQAGTNDVSGHPVSDQVVKNVATGVKTILDLCRSKAPSATVILTGIFPRWDDSRANQNIAAINREIARFADGHRVMFLNVSDKITQEMMNPDGLHPGVKGYQVWADGLKPILTQLLGLPASTDHAPPPTGDPSLNPPRRPGFGPGAAGAGRGPGGG